MGRVFIQTLAGRSLLERELDGSPVRALKQAIAEEFCIPNTCQQLFLSSGSRVLEDEERLGVQCAGGQASVSLTLVVTLEALHQTMRAGGPREREQALGVLTKLGPKGGGAAIAVVSTCIEDEDEFVRRTAVETLAQVAERGDAGALALALTLLHDGSERVRLAALRALGRLAARGDAQAIAAVGACLEAGGALACMAVEVLGEVAADPIGAVVACLEHHCKAVRWAAVRFLAQLHDCADGRILPAIVGRLEDEDRGVRHSAVQTLSDSTKRGRSAVLEGVTARLGHKEWAVRLAALQVLGALAECDDQLTLLVIVASLEDEDRRVKLGALQALIQAGERGHLAAATAVGACLEHGDVTLRHAAWEAWSRLQQLFHRRDY